MKRNNLISNIRLIAYALLLALLAGCAANGTTKKQSIEERVDSYWQLVLAGDYVGSYEYTSPGFRSSVTLNQYQRSMLLKKVKWEQADFIESDCTDITCKVAISLKYTVFAAVPGVKSFTSSQKIIESWVLADGAWYLVPET